MSAEAAALGQATGSTAAATGALRYTRTAIVLHWLIAALMLTTIPLGIYGADVEGPSGQVATNVHKPIGIAILLLTVARIGWRFAHRPPRLPETMKPLLRFLARLTHALFYVLLLLLPLSGWWMTSAFPKRHPIDAFGLFQIPFLPVQPSMASASAAHEVHETLGWVMIVLIVLHVAAALKHHFIDRDEILARMLGRHAG